MRSQIIAPKARKINSYSSHSPKDNSGLFEDFCPSDNIRILKRNSVCNLHENLIEKYDDNVCQENFEFEIEEHITKISAFNEINNIVFLTSPNSEQIRKMKRCENPFKKNFEFGSNFESDYDQLKLTFKEN